MPREWRDFTAAKGHRGSDDKVTDLTGWPPDVLSVMWNAYEAILPVTNARRPHSKQAYFFLAYRYIKLGPKVRELYSVLHTPYTGRVGKKAFYKHIVPIIIALGENVDMIRWDDRLARDNHCLMFPVGVTGIVDCFPIRVQTPRKYAESKYLYQPKYGFCVFKVQLVISLKGEWCNAAYLHCSHIYVFLQARSCLHHSPTLGLTMTPRFGKFRWPMATCGSRTMSGCLATLPTRAATTAQSSKLAQPTV